MEAKIPRRRTKHVPRPGHYAGITSQGESISFDLTQEDVVTNLIVTVSNHQRSDVFSITKPFPVDASGACAAVVAGSDVTLRFRARLEANGQASGSLHITDAATETNPANPPSRAVSWSARATQAA